MLGNPPSINEAATSSSILKPTDFTLHHKLVILLTYSSVVAQSCNFVDTHFCNSDTFLPIPESEKASTNESHASLAFFLPVIYEQHDGSINNVSSERALRSFSTIFSFFID